MEKMSYADGVSNGDQPWSGVEPSFGVDTAGSQGWNIFLSMRDRICYGENNVYGIHLIDRWGAELAAISLKLVRRLYQ